MKRKTDYIVLGHYKYTLEREKVKGERERQREIERRRERQRVREKEIKSLFLCNFIPLKTWDDDFIEKRPKSTLSNSQ